MKRLLVLAGLTALLTFGVDAHAAPSKQLRNRINMMLRAPEYAPSGTEWRALGADAPSVLRQVALDNKRLAVHRGRAATALSYFKTSLATSTLTQLVQDPKQGWLLRGKAAHSLARLEGEQSLSTIKPLLAAKHRRLREVAIKALADVPVSQSRQLLKDRLPRESSAHLRTLLKRSISRIDRIRRQK